jgi:hypothetical protein
MVVNQAAISAQLQAAQIAVQTAIANAGTISTATPFALAPVAAAVAAEIATLQNAIAQYDADIITGSVAGMVSGPPAPTLWPVLLAQIADSTQIAVLLNALGYLQRLSSNLAQATG